MRPMASESLRRIAAVSQLKIGLQWGMALGLAVILFSGCSIRRLAVNRLGDALAAGGSTFSSDEDPELIRDAAPFSLKTMEVILADAPKHIELRRAAAAGFVQYAYAFVQQEADELEQSDYSASETFRQRARKLYLRGRSHGLRGLEARHAGFESFLRTNAPGAVALLKREDVPLLYWTCAAWAAAISQSKDQPELIGELPLVQSMIDRAFVLDESWGSGAIHSFLVSYEMIRPGNVIEAVTRARQHFEKARALSGRHLAGPYVGYAESVCVPMNDREQFEANLQEALKINPDVHPEWRLENLIMQRRARWLLTRVDDFFVSHSKPSP